jgi:uncharacterized damage-inducible protein DinB
VTWTAPAVDRRSFVFLGDERTQLQGWLDYYRDTLLWKCAGLTAEQLKAPSVEPSTLTLLGLVRHMAEVERGWFRIRSGGQELPWLYCTDDNPDGDFDDVPVTDAAADLDLFRAECAAADAALDGVSLDHLFHHSRRGHDISVRWAVNHVIEEYARHCGHADLIRERIDGATGA